MKRFLAALCIGFVLTSCVKPEQIEDLQNQINQLKNDQIASIESQISSINGSIIKLETTEERLKEYISTLLQKQSELQAKDAALEQSIKDLKIEIYNKISEEKAALLEQLITTQQVIQQQISEIRANISMLEAKDKSLDEKDAELQSQINSLKEELTKLEAEYAQLIKDINTLEENLRLEITAAQNAVLSQLEAYKSEVAGNIRIINNNIANLQSKDENLQGQITSLKDYVNGELKSTKDWVSATFVTLEQHNLVCTTIAGIQADISSIKETINSLYEKITANQTHLTNLINDLDAKTEEALTSAVEQLNSSITTAKEEITATYTSAIASAITSVESSLKTWVNEQLTGYYTIAEMDAKILQLKKAQEDGDEDLKQEIVSLSNELNQTKADIKAAYEKAISDAITSCEGKINDKIAADIKAASDALQNQIDSISEKIKNIEIRLGKVEESLEAILSRIQSINVLPSYADGSVKIKDTSSSEIYFEILPRSESVKLANQELDIFSFDAINTETKSFRFQNIPIKSIRDDGECFIISVDATKISPNFFAGDLSLSGRLKIDDGNNVVSTSFFQLSPYIMVKELSFAESEITVPQSTENIDITVSVFPSIATNQKIEWISSNESVVQIQRDFTSSTSFNTIDSGTATITAYAENKSIKAEINVIVKPGPLLVNLGLSVKWASYNVGATKPEEYGDYFAFGEVEPKEEYSWLTHKWCEGGDSNQLTKYNSNPDKGIVDNKSILDKEDDAAYVQYGKSYCIPSPDDWKELRNECKWEWTTINGISGYKITGTKEGFENESIFLPASGSNGVINGSGYYAACTCLNGLAVDFQLFNEGLISGGAASARCNGISVRAVSNHRY
ncbi:MAG: hypothetical protein MR809_07860 [Rikenellaceae bacterium]|nr:hypothetical protein [Rikenellaceae bacterium]